MSVRLTLRDMEQRRWERDADRLRKSAPAWLDAERLPWWLLALLGVGWATRGLYVLLDGSSTGWDRFWAAGLLLMVAPAHFLGAYRRHRGIPLGTPLPPLRRR